jgi:hypothetical protein
MHRFIHVGFAFERALKMRDLEPVFLSTGDDWIRYSAVCWIIWTDKSTHYLFNLLRQHIDERDQILIAPIQPGEVIGRLSPWIWNWFNTKSPQTPFDTGESVEQSLLHSPFLGMPPARK